jgi:hypothetical protein
VKTPTSTAAVRGTAFVTNVTQQPDGTLRVSYEADDGQLLVSAAAGGTTTVNANQGVTVDTNQQAPVTSTPLPPQPSLRVTSSANTGFALTGPNGGTCGSAGNKTEIFGCLQNGNTITIRNPNEGRYGVLMTAAAAATGTLTVDALRGTTVEATRTFTRAFNLGDLVRTAFAYGAGTPATVGAFDAAELVTSVCGAVGRGTVFSSGSFQQRIDAVTRFGQSNHNAAVAFVATEQELNDELARQLAASPDLPVSNAHITVSASGLSFTAAVNSPIGTITASGDASMGPSEGKIAIRVRSLSAGPVPQPALDQVRGTIEKSATPISDAMPFNVQQVALRTGCFAIMGTTR